ncbi:MAG: type II toxin-antitoxin system RelE family toxin [Chloroflexota bacterium]
MIDTRARLHELVDQLAPAARALEALRQYQSPRARQDLAELDQTTTARIHQAITSFDGLGIGDVKKIKGQTDTWRLRVGDWRVFFTTDGPDLTVRRVLNSRDAYR